MKKLIITTISLFIINQFIAQVSNSEILNFAKKNYMSLLGNIPEKNLGEYGLSTKADLKSLKFIQIFTEYSNQAGKLTPTQNYRVMVLNKENKPCGLLTVFNSNSTLSVVDFGALELAKELTTQKQNIKAKSLGIYRDFEKRCDYLFDNAIANTDASYHKLFTKTIFKYNDVISSPK